MQWKMFAATALLTVGLGFPVLAENTASADVDSTAAPVGVKPEKGGRGHGHGEMLKEKLQLTDDQAKQLRTLMGEVRQAREGMKGELDALRTKHRQEMTALLAKIEAKRQEILAKAKAFLSAEQYQKLLELLSQRREKEKMAGEHRKPIPPPAEEKSAADK